MIGGSRTRFCDGISRPSRHSSSLAPKAMHHAPASAYIRPGGIPRSSWWVPGGVGDWDGSANGGVLRRIKRAPKRSASLYSKDLRSLKGLDFQLLLE